MHAAVPQQEVWGHKSRLLLNPAPIHQFKGVAVAALMRGPISPEVQAQRAADLRGARPTNWNLTTSLAALLTIAESTLPLLAIRAVGAQGSARGKSSSDCAGSHGAQIMK